MSESAGVIECSGSVALAKLLHGLKVNTRARIVGVTAANAAGVATTVIAGGLAEVQQATEFAKTLSGISDTALFVRPDKEAMSLLLKSLMIAASESVEQALLPVHPRVRPVEDLHLSEMESWNVHELRRYARTLESLPIKGRDISKATRAELLHFLQTGGYVFGGTTSPRAYPAPNELTSVN